MSDQVIIILAIIGGILVLIGMWRYSKLKVRGRVLDMEGELSGERNDSSIGASNPDVRARRDVTTTIGGDVRGSTVSSAGGDYAKTNKLRKAGKSLEYDSNVKTEVEGGVNDSEIKSVGGNVQEKPK